MQGEEAVNYFTGQQQPPDNQKGQCWIKTDATGKPIESFVWNGHKWVTPQQFVEEQMLSK